MHLSVRLLHHGVANVGAKGCLSFGCPHIRLRYPSQQDAQQSSEPATIKSVTSYANTDLETSLNNMIESMFMFIFRTVSVRMVMVMVMVSMIMMVRVPMSMAMRMSMVRVTTHCHHAEQIDEQSHSTDQKKLIGIHLWWIQPKVSYISPHHASWTVVPLCSQALYGFKYDEN